MAKFESIIPDKEMKAFKKMYDNAEEMIGEMTKAGANVAMNNMKSNAPSSAIASHIKLSKTYKTPSDGGINTKVYISGYLPFSDPNRKYFTRRGANGKLYSTTKGVPVAFLAQLYEYGRSNGNPWPKKPFMRKSFRKKEIEKAMKNVEESYVYKWAWGKL